MGSPPRMRGKLAVPSTYTFVPGITPAHAGKTYRKTCRFCINQDHPRACGENSMCSRHALYVPGSPPRMRGKRRDRRNHRHCSRITPAHAGKTIQRSIKSPPEQDHPRACGENCRGWPFRMCFSGSPPRMRGKLTKPEYSRTVYGITPAHAGKTL